MTHVYFACCTPDGGIEHYIKDGDRYIFRDRMACDSPMYLDLEGDVMHVLLRAPYTDSDHSALVDYSVREDGSLGDVSPMTDTQGVIACHLCHKDGKEFYVNYMSGNVASNHGDLSCHEGHGPNPARQEMAHTHYIFPSPDGKYLLSCDLGLDSIFTYDTDLNIASVAKVPDGHGARHLAYSEDGKYVFCVNELTCTVSVFAYCDGVLTLKDTVDALPESSPDTTGAAIRVRGDLVYTSHRGADVVSVMSWRNEKLTLLGTYPCGGKSPRDMLPVEDHILCTNERSDDVTVLRINGDHLELTDIRLPMPAPLCVITRK